MPNAGRLDGKYVYKIHWDATPSTRPPWITLCGKRIHLPAGIAVKVRNVTCKSCRKILAARRRVQWGDDG